MNPTQFIFASDFSGILQFFIWLGVNGFYTLMLLITAVGCIGWRNSRATDDLSRALVMGGITLFFSLALLAWHLLEKRPPDWGAFSWYAGISLALWGAALLLRWWQRKK